MSDEKQQDNEDDGIPFEGPGFKVRLPKVIADSIAPASRFLIYALAGYISWIGFCEGLAKIWK